MNWEAISAIGQVLGALGVIASLIYLGTQVRQNNRASAVAGKLASAQLLRELVDSPITDPTLIDLRLWGHKNLKPLNNIEHLRFVRLIDRELTGLPKAAQSVDGSGALRGASTTSSVQRIVASDIPPP